MLLALTLRETSRVAGGGGEFDQEPSGRNMFVLMRLGASPAPKSPTTGDETNPAPAQAQQ
jgi:hypothetical protein